MSTFSHSRIDTFETCPKKYEFAYVLKEPRGPSGVEAFMGSRVHDALEWLYGEVRACRLPEVEGVLSRYLEGWEAEWSDDVAIVRAERTADDYRAIGEKALRDYHRRYHPFDQGTTVGLELRVALALDDEHEVIGFIDRLTKVTDHVWEIHDYKTSASLMTQDKADIDRQLALYELAVREMYPDAEHIELVWHYLVFDHEIRSTRTPEQLAGLWSEVLEQIGNIEAQSSFPTRSSRLCDWCDYRRVCPAWRHMFEAAEMPPERFAEEPGVTLVDRYLALSDGIDEMQAEREDLKRAIVQRADDEGLDRLFGTAGSIKVFRYESVGLPDARDPRRTELETVLREEGLLDRYSQLSSYALSKDIGAGGIPAEPMARIEPFVTVTRGAKLYPNRRSGVEPC